MTIQPENLQTAGPTTIAAFPKRIEPDKHGGCQSRKFARVLVADTLEVGTPIAFNEVLDAFVSWDPNTNLGVDVNEVQKLVLEPDYVTAGSTYKLVFKGVSSASIASDASAATIQTAAQAMSTIGAGNLLVTGTGPFTLTFAGALAGAPQPLITVNDAGFQGSAGSATVSQSTPGVVGGAQNEVQTISITGTPTGGTFTLDFDGQTTAPIAFNASAATVLAAIIALSNVPAGAFTAAGGALPGTPVVLTAAGAFVGVDLPAITANGAALAGGTTPAVTVAETTEGDIAQGTGSPAGTLIGFVYPNPIVRSVDGEVFGTIMFKGLIHRDDMVLPTLGSPTAAQLDAACRDGLLARGILVQGVSNVH